MDVSLRYLVPALVFITVITFFKWYEARRQLRVKSEDAFSAWWSSLNINESRLVQVIVLSEPGSKPLAYGDERVFVVVYNKRVQRSMFAFLPLPRTGTRLECQIGDVTKVLVSRSGQEGITLHFAFETAEESTPQGYESEVTCAEASGCYLMLVQDSFLAMRCAVLLEETKGGFFKECLAAQKADARTKRTFN